MIVKNKAYNNKVLVKYGTSDLYKDILDLTFLQNDNSVINLLSLLNDLQAKDSELATTVSTLKADYDSKIDKLTSALADVVDTCKKQSESIAELQEKVNTLEEK